MRSAGQRARCKEARDPREWCASSARDRGLSLEQQSPLRGVGARTLLSKLREEEKAEAGWVGRGGAGGVGGA